MKSCLIVDDSKVIRMVARKIMQELGFETIEAADGQEALDECKSKLPDAVLLDWNMPVMDGLEFLVEMRKLADAGKKSFPDPKKPIPLMREKKTTGRLTRDKYVDISFLNTHMLESLNTSFDKKEVSQIKEETIDKEDLVEPFEVDILGITLKFEHEGYN